jgi:hypothetical protein
MAETLNMGGEIIENGHLQAASLAIEAFQGPQAPAYYDTTYSGGLGLPEAVVQGGSQTTTRPTSGTASGGGGNQGGTSTSRR